MGIIREDFSSLTGIEVRRLENIEYCRARMAEDEFESICSQMPEVALWLTFGGDISLEALKASEAKHSRLIAAKFENELLPPDSPLIDKIK